MARTRPLIGVTTQTLHAIDGIPQDLPVSWVMNQRYVHAVMAAGGVPVLIPLLAEDPATLRAIYERIDGVLIPGGVDIDPAYYRTPRHEKLGRLDPARDTSELVIARWAVKDAKPLLGLCRGLQVLNVALGGSLWQDLAEERPKIRSSTTSSRRPAGPANTGSTRSRFAAIPASAKPSGTAPCR